MARHFAYYTAKNKYMNSPLEEGTLGEVIGKHFPKDMAGHFCADIVMKNAGRGSIGQLLREETECDVNRKMIINFLSVEDLLMFIIYLILCFISQG